VGRTRHLLVLARDAVHERRELEVVRLADGLGLHLDVEVPALVAANDLANLFDRALEALDGALLVGRVGHHDVQRRRDEADLDRDLVGREALARGERLLDREDAVVAKVGHLEVGADLDRLRREALGDVGAQLGEDVFGDVEAGKDRVGLAAGGA